MLDRSFARALRNFTTVFLLVAALTIPLHLAYSVIFKNVIETRELHPVIAEFPNARQVRGVGTDQLAQARIGLLLITLLEIAAIPWLAHGTAHVLDRDDQGGTPFLGDALRAARSPVSFGSINWSRHAGSLAVAALISLAIAFLVERSGLVLLEFVSDTRVYPLFGLLQGVSRAAAGPFLLTTIALCVRAKDLPPKTPTLY